MKSTRALVQSQSLEPLGRPSVWVTWDDEPLVMRPGQVLLVQPGDIHLLPFLCLPIQIRSQGLLLEKPQDAPWSPGDQLLLWGPVGQPFAPPENCLKWLLLAPILHAGRLLPLVEAGLKQGASVALWSRQPVPQLPPAVELLAEPTEGLAWADYIAIDLADVNSFEPSAVGFGNLDAPGVARIEVLRTPPMPCGFGGCGLCAVKGTQGWKLACLNGPVFDWNEMDF